MGGERRRAQKCVAVCVLLFTGFAYMTKDKKKKKKSAFSQSAQMCCSVLEGGAQDVSEPVRGICTEGWRRAPVTCQIKSWCAGVSSRLLTQPSGLSDAEWYGSLIGLIYASRGGEGGGQDGEGGRTREP